MRRCTAQFGLTCALFRIRIRAFVLEDDERRNDLHFALARRTVMLIHVENRLKQRLHISFIESRFRCKIRADEATHLIQTKGDNLLASHRAQLIFRRFLFRFLIFLVGFVISAQCRRHARDGYVQRQYRIQTLAESKLNRTADLPRIGASRHHSPKGAHIVEEFTRFFACRINRVFFFRTFNPCFALCQRNLLVQIHRLLHENPHARHARISNLNIVANAAFRGHVGDKSLHGLRVNPGHVAHIRVAVRVGIGASNIVHKFVTVLQCHFLIPPRPFLPQLSVPSSISAVH